MKITIITAVFNRAETIEDCMKSVHGQSYGDIEHIIIDGGSTDGTLDIIEKYRTKLSKVISEKDDGIYHALNKGIGLSNGDIIGFLHSDDMYSNCDVLKKVADAFGRARIDSCYGDLLYVDKNDIKKVVRYWKSSEYTYGKFRYGWMPPHPTFFVRRKVYESYGGFNTDLKIAADYELMLRFIEKHRVSTLYIPEVLITMRMGGESNKSLRNMLRKSFEDYKAWKINGLRGGIDTIFLKNFSKIPQFIRKKRPLI